MIAQFNSRWMALLLTAALLTAAILGLSYSRGQAAAADNNSAAAKTLDVSAAANVQQMITQGRQTFRFDTFGDEARPVDQRGPSLSLQACWSDGERR